MTDPELSKELAKAIGWSIQVITQMPYEDGYHCLVYTGNNLDKVKLRKGWMRGFRIFDYRDWHVAGPLADHYQAFPFKHSQGWRSPHMRTAIFADTSLKAIALAVIEASK